MSMGKAKGRSEGRSESERAALDLEHELPAADDRDDRNENHMASAPGDAGSGSETELQKLKAERDSLLDRLARTQAEFENARRRTIKEQQEFREFLDRLRFAKDKAEFDQFMAELRQRPPAPPEHPQG